LRLQRRFPVRGHTEFASVDAGHFILEGHDVFSFLGIVSRMDGGVTGLAYNYLAYNVVSQEL